MTTVNQLIRNGRQKKRKKISAPALRRNGRPSGQIRGVVEKVKVHKPKKPNSAERKVVRVKLTNGKKVTAYIPGESTAANITEHSIVLLRGGGPPDLPGVNYTVIPGAKGTINGTPGPAGGPGGTVLPAGMRWGRKQSRSKYGVKKPA